MSDLRPPITIRPFRESDLPGMLDMILAIQQGEFGRFDPESERTDLHAIAAIYQVGAGGFWVADADGEIVGCVALKDMGGGRAALKRMYVAANWRGSAGTAVKLLDAALDHAREHGVGEVYLGTIDILVAARRFYEREGFEPIARGDLPPSTLLSEDDTHFYRRRLSG